MIYSVISTQVLTATAIVAASAVATLPVYMRVASDVSCHIRVGASAALTDFYLRKDSDVIFPVGVGETLTVLKAAGEADGSAWVSTVVMS